MKIYEFERENRKNPDNLCIELYKPKIKECYKLVNDIGILLEKQQKRRLAELKKKKGKAGRVSQKKIKEFYKKMLNQHDNIHDQFFKLTKTIDYRQVK